MEEITTATVKPCDLCGKPVGKGRSDKKYCSDACKTEANNQNKLPEYISAINNILVKNWKILKDCLGTQDKCKMRVRDLGGRGFNFKFTTAERINVGDGECYYFVYDMGYLLLDEETRVLIVQDDTMVRLTGPAYPV
jgi:predicted nucleic acid-binding Zn ribbon protein